jgi:mycothiol synthase
MAVMIIAQTESDSELRQALRLLIHRPGLSQADIDHQIRSLLRHAESRGLSLDHCLVGREEDEIVSCCLSVDSPGRTSAVYTPSWIPDGQAADRLVSLLNEAAERARHRQIHFLQSIIPLEASLERKILERAAFERLAELIYMDNDLTLPLLVGKPPPSLTRVTYSPDTHSLFAKVVLETYEGSLDCVRLNGLREIDEILDTHRATGVFDPLMWFVGVAEGDPVGALLLARIPEQAAVEVVYMGLRPSYRGRGYATALLTHGTRIARDQAALRMTLAVDVLNVPARHLYEQFGFRELTRRCAWIRVLESRSVKKNAAGRAGS